MPSKGYKQIEEHKRKISEAQKRIGNRPPSRLGKKHTEESKERMRQSNLGRISPLRGRVRIDMLGDKNFAKRPDIRKKISEAKLKNPTRIFGTMNHAWKGGITPLRKAIRWSFEYRQWRCDIFTRDNWMCRECSIKTRNIEAHHSPLSLKEILEEYQIKTWEEARRCAKLWDINNGITLCRKCHEKTYSK